MFCCTKNSFCFMRLPTAGIVIGWLTGLISLVLSAVSILMLVTINNDSVNPGTTQALLGQLLVTGISLAIAVYLAINVLDFIASILLIIGAKRDSHLMLLPWLTNNAILVVLKLFIIPLSLIQDVWSGILLLVICAIQCWVWIGICLLFRSIRASKDQLKEKKAGLINYELFYNTKDVTNQPNIAYVC